MRIWPSVAILAAAGLLLIDASVAVATSAKLLPDAHLEPSASASGFVAINQDTLAGRSAKAAEDSAFWTMCSVLIGSAGLAGVIASLVFSGIAARAASTSAEMASLEVKMSRESLALKERAYVSQSAFTIMEDFEPTTDIIIRYRIGVEWRNSGNTPAQGAISVINWHISELPIDLDRFDYPGTGQNPQSRGGIGPGCTVRSGQIPISAEEIRRIVQGTGHLLVWGWYEYDDVFPLTPRHRTEFCLRVGVDAFLYPRQVRFIEAHEGRHNGIDSSCLYSPKTKKQSNKLAIQN